MLNDFSKKAVLSEKIVKNGFWGRILRFFRERRRLAPKINITFFITNWVLNSLFFNSFFKKSCIFQENGEKLFLEAKSLLKRRRHLATKM